MCEMHTKSRAAFEAFDMSQISNNHLLSPDPAIRDAILSTSIGDQVHFQGLLVNYYPEGQPASVRKTSLTRDDTGNGACEVVFVERFEVLSRGNQTWRSLRDYGPASFLLLLAAAAVLFMMHAYAQ